MAQDSFESLLEECRTAVERFVYYRMPSQADAEDILQEVYLAAYQRFPSLRDKAAFKAWLIRIASNKCNDFYRERARQLEIPLDALGEAALTQSRYGPVEAELVRETVAKLPDKDRQILYLYYFRNRRQSEIAELLGLPLGTVKSRLHTARQSFKQIYPYPPKQKGVNPMQTFPEFMPAYTIQSSEKLPFPVKWEEMMGWFIIPKPGESLSWAMYDFPERKRTESVDMKVTGLASVHGINGVEIAAIEHLPRPDGGTQEIERRFVAQLTDTHCRILAESHMEGEIKRYNTFLDGDAFLPNWGFGEENCGNETNLAPKGIVRRDGNNITCPPHMGALDVTGRYTVEINGKRYDTICVMNIGACQSGVVSEQYIDANGRTILWRRFNRDDWAFDRYGKLWSQQLPANEQIQINGHLYVHWYDCITDQIF